MNSTPDIDNLIAYENEHSTLGFKAIQYDRDKHEALLKDILAMANAQVESSSNHCRCETQTRWLA
jgi:hypothetical protein